MSGLGSTSCSTIIVCVDWVCYALCVSFGLIRQPTVYWTLYTVCYLYAKMGCQLFTHERVRELSREDCLATIICSPHTIFTVFSYW